MATSAASGQERIYFRDLDLVRFAAAYMVVLFHIYYGWQANWGDPSFLRNATGGLSPAGVFAERFFHNLSFGVDIFFLISGFLITYLLLAEREKTGTVAVGKFYLRRVLRIWPLYFLILGTGPLLHGWVNEPEPGSYLPHAFFLGNFELIRNGFSSVSVNHLWSICIEEHFYLVCPLLVAFLPVKRLPHVFWGIILISFCYRGIISGTENYWMKMYLHTLSRMDVLAIGCLTAWYVFHGRLGLRTSPYTRAFCAVFLGLLFINEVYVYWDNFFLATSKKYVYVLLTGILIAPVFIAQNSAGNPRKPGFFHYLGKISYGIYMFNPLAVALFIKLYHATGFQDGMTFFTGVNLLVLTLSVLSYELFEKKVLRLKDRFTIIRTRS
jgi:peptidoglycan/LPS O-acetylase OafA/YrhL